MSDLDATTAQQGGWGRWLWRLVNLVIIVMAISVIVLTNQLLTERYTETTRSRAEVRMTLYVGNLISELQRNSIVPQLLARDAELVGALKSNDFTDSSQRLLGYVDEIGAASLMLLDNSGRTVAATDRSHIGELHRNDHYFVSALRSNVTVFSIYQTEVGTYSFVYSRRIDDGGSLLGVLAVEVDLQKLVSGWAGVSDAVFVTDSTGAIVLSTEPRWNGLEEVAALSRQSAPSAIERAIRATQDWTTVSADAYLQGEAVLRQETKVPFQGWRMVTFTTYTSIREKVNGVLALEIMGFAILLALVFWFSSRKATTRLLFSLQESAQLRALNLRLQKEIAEREKVEKTLQVAEQSLAQSSKLAALGEMSAAVSHELNQPLAAMKTYLAGARLLVQRRRMDEAVSSFQRIDDLIERMSAITRQLKSYARKGADSFAPVDTREAVTSALAMMEPQLRTRDVAITRTLPTEPALILGDRMRLEQVIINLLRNALDATKGEDDPSVDVFLTVGDTVRLSVRDNGPGIDNLDALFEPFYTTKQPGDGVGLGLAISSGIVSELGGRLTAHNAPEGGAVFEVQLPIYKEDVEAAE